MTILRRQMQMYKVGEACYFFNAYTHLGHCQCRNNIKIKSKQSLPTLTTWKSNKNNTINFPF